MPDAVISILLFLGGIVLLTVGSNLLLKGAEVIARIFGISELVIGLTIVAMGTSAPELAISTVAAVEGKDGIAIGNVVGSNICNVLLILGACGAIAPLVVQRQLIKFDMPVMIVASILVILMGLDGQISTLEGSALIGGLVWYVYKSIKNGKANRYDESIVVDRSFRNLFQNLALVIVGLVVLIGGSQVALDGAIRIAKGLGLSEAVIGLTIVAVGTSFPEIATSIVATLKGQRDLAIGNVVGSNIFNILCILGFSTAVGNGLTLSPGMLIVEIPIMIFVAIVLLPMMITHSTLSRVEGFLLLLGYGFYLIHTLVHELWPQYLGSFVLFSIGFGAILVGSIMLSLKDHISTKK